MPSGNSLLANQNTFQNAGQNGYFNYNEIGNQSSTFLVLILCFILLISLLRSEARLINLMERMMSQIERDH